MNHLALVNLAKQALDKVFSDRSVSRQDTKASLEDIKDELEILIDSVTD